MSVRVSRILGSSAVHSAWVPGHRILLVKEEKDAFSPCWIHPHERLPSGPGAWPPPHLLQCGRSSVAAVGFISGQNVDCFKIILWGFPTHASSPGLSPTQREKEAPKHGEPHRGVEEWNGQVTPLCTQLGKHVYITPLCLLEVMVASTLEGQMNASMEAWELLRTLPDP